MVMTSGGKEVIIWRRGVKLGPFFRTLAVWQKRAKSFLFHARAFEVGMGGGKKRSDLLRFLLFCFFAFQAKIFTASFQHELPGQKRRDTKEFWPRRQTHKTFCVVTSEETKSCSIFNILRHRPWQTIDGRWNRSRHAGKRFQPFSEYSICSFIQPQRAFVEAETL